MSLKILPGANHLYQAARTGGVSEYASLKKEFVPGFLDTISQWIRDRAHVAAVAPGPAGPSPVPRSPAPAAAVPAPRPAAGSVEARARAFHGKIKEREL